MRERPGAGGADDPTDSRALRWLLADGRGDHRAQHAAAGIGPGQARAARRERAGAAVAGVEPTRRAPHPADANAAGLWRRHPRPPLLCLRPGSQPAVTGSFLAAPAGASVSTVSNSAGKVI